MNGAGSKSLLAHPPPVWSESPIGYVLRLSEENFYPNGAAVLKVLGIKVWDAIALGSSGLYNLARGKSTAPTSDGTALRAAMWNAGFQPKYSKVCGACLRERSFCEAAWDLKLSLFCSKHWKVLFSHCPNCGMPISYARPSPRLCTCGRDFSQEPANDAPVWAKAYQRKYLAEAVGFAGRRSAESVYREREALLQIKSLGWYERGNVGAFPTPPRRVQIEVDAFDYAALRRDLMSEAEWDMESWRGQQEPLGIAA